MDLSNITSQLTANKKLLVIAGVGLTVFVVLIYSGDSTPEAPPKNAEPASTATIQAKPIMPNGFAEVAAIKRDPFVLPTELNQNANPNPPSAAPTANQTPAGGQPVAQPKPQLDYRLTGIAGTVTMQIAVIQTDGKSKAYQINDSVGTYKVTKISNDSVILTDPAGEKKVLQLVKGLQAGGSQSAK